MRKEMEMRLIQFSIQLFDLSKKLDGSFGSNHLSNQIFRSSTSAALNFAEAQGAESDYVFRLWMAHGITTVREPSGRGIDYALNLKKLSSQNKITAPRIVSYTGFGQVSDSFNPLNDKPINTPEKEPANVYVVHPVMPSRQARLRAKR